MSSHTFGALLIGVVAVVVGAGWTVAAVSRLRRRSEMTTSLGSSASGIYTYNLVQVGCGGLLILGGLVILALALLR